MQLLPMTRTNTDDALLSQTRVATPCRADWNAMTGDTRSRFCGSCRKNVYNLSAMTQSEAAALIREKEGKLCVRYFERADGTVLTQDCPVGVAAVRRRMARVVAAGIVGFAALFSTVTRWWISDTGENLFATRLHYWAEIIHPTPQPEPQIMGDIAFPVEPTTRPVETLGYVEYAPEPPAVMGKMKLRVPAPPVEPMPMLGEVAPYIPDTPVKPVK